MSDTSSVLHRHPKTRNFTQVENSSIRDSGLSYRATGLLVYLLSLPDGSRIDSITLSGRKVEGRDAIRAAYKELETAGYVRRERKARGNGGKWASQIHVYEVPVPENPAPVDPAPGKPASGDQALSLSESNTDGKEGEIGSVVCPICCARFDDMDAMADHYSDCVDPDFTAASSIPASMDARYAHDDAGCPLEDIPEVEQGARTLTPTPSVEDERR